MGHGHSVAASVPSEGRREEEKGGEEEREGREEERGEGGEGGKEEGEGLIECKFAFFSELLDNALKRAIYRISGDVILELVHQDTSLSVLIGEYSMYTCGPPTWS